MCRPTSALEIDKKLCIALCTRDVSYPKIERHKKDEISEKKKINWGQRLE